MKCGFPSAHLHTYFDELDPGMWLVKKAAWLRAHWRDRWLTPSPASNSTRRTKNEPTNGYWTIQFYFFQFYFRMIFTGTPDHKDLAPRTSRSRDLSLILSAFTHGIFRNIPSSWFENLPCLGNNWRGTPIQYDFTVRAFLEATNGWLISSIFRRRALLWVIFDA